MVALLIANLTAVMTIRMNDTLVPGFPTLFVYVVLAGLHAAAVSFGYVGFRAAETMNEGSLAILTSIQLRRSALRCTANGDGTVERARCSLCRRKPLSVRIGSFVVIESGMAFEFLQTILDNIFTGIMMVDVTVPSMLLGLTGADRNRVLGMIPGIFVTLRFLINHG